jgi:ankyrin repeat protein
MMSSYMFQCNDCQKNFETRGKLKWVNTRFSDSQLTWSQSRHHKVHSKPYQCSHCDRGFALRHDLNRHVEARHRVGFNKHPCPMDGCDFKATRSDNLAQHLKNKHAQKPQYAMPTEETELERQNGTEDSLISRTISPSLPFTAHQQMWSYAQFYQAARTGNFLVLHASLQADLDMNHCADDGSSALHCAARTGQTSMVQYLLAMGANKDTENHKHHSPVHEAILSGNPETFECFLHSKVHLVDHQITMECLACCGSVQILKSCVAYLEENIQPHFVYRVLRNAAQIGHVPTVDMLLPFLEEAGDHVDTATEPIESAERRTTSTTYEVPWKPGMRYFHYTPMHYAAKEGHLAIVQMLSKHHVDFNLTSREGKLPLHLAARGGHTSVVEHLLMVPNSDISCKDTYSRTPLHLAVGMGRLETVEFLLSITELDVNCKDFLDHTPLHFAANRGNLQTVQLLLSKPELEVDCKDDRNFTPLHFAAQSGNPEVVQLLLCHTRIDFRCLNDTMQSPLQLAALNGNWRIAQALLKHEESRKVEPTTDDPVLESHLDRTEVLKTVLERPDFQNINISEEFSGGLLHSAVRKEEYDILKILLDHENINVNLSPERSPLYLAAELGRTEAVRMLLQHEDIDINKQAVYGETALDVARRSRHLEIVKLLLAYGAGDHDNTGTSPGKTQDTTQNPTKAGLQD